MKADQLDSIRFGFAAGVSLGLGLFMLGLIATFFKHAESVVIIIGALYPGYGNDIPGSFFGLLWGLVDGFVGGWIFAKIYNLHAHPHDIHLEKHHPHNISKIHEEGWLPATGRKKRK
jgi:hypothetical protein